MCSAGMSTSLLVNKMEKCALKMGYEDIIIQSEAIDDLPECVDEFDVFLLGPQVRYREGWVQGIVEAKGKPYGNISPQDYGRIDGEKTLELAIEIGKYARKIEENNSL